MSSPLLSVIVPNYNHARYLERRLQSIERQTFQSYEVILLDDASTDGSIEILNYWKSRFKQCKLLLNQDNSGSVFRQWHKGILASEGEYIWIAESDDFAEDSFVSTTIEVLLERTDIGISYCRSRIVNHLDQPERMLGSYYLPDSADGLFDSSFVISGKQFMSGYMIGQNSIPNASAAIFRRAEYLRRFSEPLKMKLFGDWMVWTKMLEGASLAFSHLLLNNFRQHESTVRDKYSETLGSLMDRAEIASFQASTLPESIGIIADKLAYQIKCYSQRRNLTLNEYGQLFRSSSNLAPRLIWNLLRQK